MGNLEYCRLALKKAGTSRNDLIIEYYDADQPDDIREEIIQKKVSLIKINSLLTRVKARLVSEGWQEVSIKEAEVHFMRIPPAKK